MNPVILSPCSISTYYAPPPYSPFTSPPYQPLAPPYYPPLPYIPSDIPAAMLMPTMPILNFAILNPVM